MGSGDERLVDTGKKVDLGPAAGPQTPNAEPPGGHPTPPRGLSHYRSVLVLVVVAAAAEAAYAAINMLALQVFVKDVLNLTAYLGVILGAFLLVEALMKSVMGALADRYGRWRFLGTAPIISGCTALLIASLGWWVRKNLSPDHHAPAEYHGFLQILMVLAPLIILRALDGVAAAAFWP